MIAKDADWGFFLKYGNWFISKIIQILYDGPSMREAGGTYRMIKKRCLKSILPYLTEGKSAFLIKKYGLYSLIVKKLSPFSNLPNK